MKIVNLYRYEKPDGSVLVTKNKQNIGDQVHGYRLVAEEGMLLTDGNVMTPCVDVKDTSGWAEVQDPNPPELTEVVMWM